MQRKKLVEYPSQPKVAAAVPATQPAQQVVAAQPAPMGPLPHYLGPTLKLISMLLSSWIKSQPTRDFHGDTVYPSFEVTLPGTRTKLAYNQKHQTVAIYDEVMETNWNPAYPVRSNLPNPTDPRVAGTIFALLEETHDGDMCKLIPALSMHTNAIKYSGANAVNDQRKDAFFLSHLDIFITPGSSAENLIPTTYLHALKVEGMDSITRLIECLDRTFEKHKTRTIPVGENDAVRMNFGQGL